MAEITGTTTFSVEASSVITASADIEFAPSSTSGAGAQRRLDPPGIGAGFPDLPPLVYECNPDKWTNFDASGPLKRPFTRHETTIGGAVTQEWPGYDRDVQITETWEGGGDRMSMSLPFFRLLYQYFVNRPNYDSQGFIKWSPRDLTDKQYNIVILDLSVGGTNEINLDTIVHQGYVHDAVTFTFAIVSEA